MLEKIPKGVVLKTKFWLFTLAYGMYYNLALEVIVYFFKKQKEVVAIYLVAGLAAGDCVYGLSDIDLIIIVQDGQKNKEKIDKIFGRLSYFIPLLVYREKGIFTESEISFIYQESLFYLKYKFFVECKKIGKLLYGRNILNDFPDLLPADNQRSIIGQLAFIWSNLVSNFILNDIDDRVMRNYLCYKFSADNCKAFILAQVNGELLSRPRALERIKEHLDKEYAGYIEKTQELLKNGFNSQNGEFLQETYNFCFYLLDKTVRYMNDDLYNQEKESEIKKRIHFGFENPGFILADINRQKIDKIIDLVRNDFKEYIRSILISPLDLTHIDEQTICLFIVQKRNIPIAAIKELNSIIGRNHCQQQLYLYVITSDMAVSLNRADFLQPYAVLFLPWCPYKMPLTFLYLSTPDAVLFGERLNCSKNREVLINYYLQDFSNSLAQDRIEVIKFISDPDIVRLTNLQFHLFFWQSLRLKLVEDSLSLEKISIPLSSAQVCQECSKSQSLNFNWLMQFHDEYRKDLNGMPSDSEAYFPEAITVLKKIYNLNSGDS